MMDYQSQLKLQACLDGELAPDETRQFQAQVANDPEAQALMAELRMTNAALAGFEAGLKLPESPEFFWSKIQREIQRRPEVAPVAGWTSILAGWRRWLAPAAAMAVALVAMLLIPRSGQGPQVETSLADSGAFTYHDYAARTTLVWLSYPADDGQGSQTDTLE